MKAINVLILSAGRQVMLVEAFRDAQKSRDSTGYVIAADANRLSASLEVADIGLIAPKTTENIFSRWLLGIVEQYSPLLLLTLYERDLYVLEPMRELLLTAGCQLIGMPVSTLQSCLDKRETAQVCKKLGLQAPPCWTLEDKANIRSDAFPLIAKEIYGRGSRGQSIINSLEELKNFFLEGCSDILFQKFITGDEYGIDIVNDLRRNFVVVFARKKLSMRDGETAIAEIVDPQPFIQVSQILSKHFSHQGSIDVDIIKSGSDMYILDINPRFGGGYPFSHFAGANIPAALLAWASGVSVDYSYLNPLVGQISSKVSRMQLISR